MKAEIEQKREESRAKVKTRIEEIMKFEMFAAKKLSLMDELDVLKMNNGEGDEEEEEKENRQEKEENDEDISQDLSQEENDAMHSPKKTNSSRKVVTPRSNDN